MQYQILVYAFGYNDLVKIIEAKSMSEAKRHEDQAKIEWCKANKLRIRGNFDLPDVRVSKP